MDWCRLLDSQEFDFEDEGGVGRDQAVADVLGTVAKSGRDDELALAADFHAGDAFIPTLDHLPDAELKFKRLDMAEGRINITVECFTGAQ